MSGATDAETLDEHYQDSWNEHAEDLTRLKWNLPPERHDEVDELIEDAKELIADATENR